MLWESTLLSKFRLSSSSSNFDSEILLVFPSLAPYNSCFSSSSFLSKGIELTSHDLPPLSSIFSNHHAVFPQWLHISSKKNFDFFSVGYKAFCSRITMKMANSHWASSLVRCTAMFLKIITFNSLLDTVVSSLHEKVASSLLAWLLSDREQLWFNHFPEYAF